MANELERFTKDIADAIREQEKSTDKILPRTFANRIRGLKGGSENLDAELNEQESQLASLRATAESLPDNITDVKDITENGVYTAADEGLLGYSQVNVNVEGKEDLTAELSEQDALLTNLERAVDELQEKPINPLQYKCDNAKSLYCEFAKHAADGTWTDEMVTEMMKGIDTSNVIDMEGAFGTPNATASTYRDLSNITLDMSNCVLANEMFKYQAGLKHLPKLINANKLEYIEKIFYNCSVLQEVPYLDTSLVKSFNYALGGCKKLLEIPQYNTGSATNTSHMLYACDALIRVPALDTRKVTTAQNMFSTSTVAGNKIETIELVDLRSVSSAGNISNIFNRCVNLKNLTVKNIRVSLVLSGTASSNVHYGKLLTVESLLNTIKELWINTSTTTTKLTITSANIEKIADVYVKLIDITDEMRAEDEYIDNKAPFVVCESIDEGAMLITEYVTTVKNWQLA